MFGNGKPSYFELRNEERIVLEHNLFAVCFKSHIYTVLSLTTLWMSVND